MQLTSITRELRSSAFHALLLPLSIVCWGCSDGEDRASTDPPDNVEGPLYAINTRVYGEDFANPISYIALVDRLDEGNASLDRALELPGGGSLWGIPESGVIYLVSAENQTVTKYRLNRSGRLDEVDRLGLAGEGVSGLVTESISFDGPDRGFLFDLGSAQAIELNLEKMEIEGKRDLSELLIDSVDATFIAEGGFQRRGDKFVGAVYGASANYDEVAPTSKVGFFDPVDGSLEVIDAPCGGLVYTIAAANGDWYFSADPWVAGIHALDDSRAPAPCLARLPADSASFDPETTALNDVTGGITGGLVPSSDGYAYVRVLDPDAFRLTEDTDFLEPYSAPAWTTWRIELPHPSSATKLDRPHIAGGIKFSHLDGEVYQNESKADFSSTTLVRTTGDDAPSPGLRVPGVPWNIVRVR